MDVISYKCPNCGAPMVFSIETQQWDCHFCNSSFTKEQLSALNYNESDTPIEEANWQAELFDTEMVSYSCPNCGGQVMTEPNTSATFCPYCHNPTVIAARLKGEYRPAKILPFKISKEHVLDSLKKLCKKKPLLPRKFKKCVEKGEITGLYVPYWLFRADFHSHLVAEGRQYTVWSDSQYDYKKTDIYHVERQGIIPVEQMPVDASRRLDDTLMDSIEPFHFDDLQNFSMEYLSGHLAENYDVDASVSKQRFVHRAKNTIQPMLRRTANQYDSLQVNGLQITPRNLDNLYVMLPVWTIAVPYKHKIYTFAMNGQTGKSAGKLPISAKRSWFTFLTISVVLASISIILLVLFGGGI